MINVFEPLESESEAMNKKKIGIIAGALAAIVVIGVAASFYAKGDHRGPSVTVASDFQIGYGERIGLFDLVTAVSDQSEYTIAITSGGQVAADGRSTVFDQAGSAQVEITAVDELGHRTVKTVDITITDEKPPMLLAKDLQVSLGDHIDYRSGVTAEDEMDGNLTSQIEIDTSGVDESKAGIYPVIYTVTDSAGNQAIVQTMVDIESPDAEYITLNQQTLTLAGNGHYQLSATVEPRAWAGKLQWTSSDESVAVVSDGLVTWVGYGSCTITAQAQDVSTQCQVTCGYVDLSVLYLSSGELTLEYEEVQELYTSAIPSNWNGTVTWTSSDPAVATVEDGQVAWAGAGECTITATAEGRSVSCTVICEEPEIESLTFVEDEINLSANGTYVITPLITPEVWTGEITWTSSDPNVATVEDGLVRWVAPGTCTITATAGECSATIQVNCAKRGTIGDLIDDILGGGDDEDTDEENGHQDD